MSFKSCNLENRFVRKNLINFFYLKFQLRIVALNEPYSGNLMGWSGAESKCYYEGIKLGIATFKPFLAARNINLEPLVVRNKERDWPVYNLKVSYSARYTEV